MTTSLASCAPASGRLLAGRIVAATTSIVNGALHGDWRGVADTAARRRILLDRLARPDLAIDETVVSALQAAVAESESLLSLLMPREMACSSRLMLS